MAAEPVNSEVRLKEREFEHKERELEHNAQMKVQEMEHAERMLALEFGQPLPEAYTARIRAVGSIGTLVPIGVATAAAATTLGIGGDHWVLLGIVWGHCGLVILLTVWLSLLTLRRLGGWPHGGKRQSPTALRS
jgi:hypothetical protein